MIRRTLFWTHLSIGAAAGAAILIMSVTGAMLAFERQAVQFADRDFRTVSDPLGARTHGLSELLATASSSANAQPSSLTVRPDATASVEFAFGRERTIYVDPYTGAVLGEGSRSARQFFSSVERWHRSLGGPLRAYADAANLLFLGLILTGAYLWLPRKWSWNAVRAAALFRGGRSGRARDWNWHNVAGAWCAIPLLVLALSGVIMSYPWANALLFRIARSPMPQRSGPPLRGMMEGGGGRPAHGGPERIARPGEGFRSADGPARTAANLDMAVSVAAIRFPQWRSLTLHIPNTGETAVSVSVDTGSGGEVEKRSQLTIDTATSRITRESRFADGSLGQRLRSLVRFLHTGEEFGIAGESIAALASAGGALLVWTGLALALRRLVRRSRRQFSASSTLAPADAQSGSRGWRIDPAQEHS